MKVFITPSRDTKGKYESLVQAFPDVWDGSVLDVGCRQGNLRRALPDGNTQYCGLDRFLSPNINVIGDALNLPFDNESFDTVVCLDVLEHTDDIHKGFNELCRVSRKYVLICLPNAYEIKCRLNFLLGRQISGKYGLPLDPPDDRHRWLFSFQESKDFSYRFGEKHGFEIVDEGSLIGPHRGYGLGRYLVAQLPNLLSPWYVVLLKRKVLKPSST